MKKDKRYKGKCFKKKAPKKTEKIKAHRDLEEMMKGREQEEQK
jgi:hypothetical protein